MPHSMTNSTNNAWHDTHKKIRPSLAGKKREKNHDSQVNTELLQWLPTESLLSANFCFIWNRDDTMWVRSSTQDACHARDTPVTPPRRRRACLFVGLVFHLYTHFFSLPAFTLFSYTSLHQLTNSLFIGSTFDVSNEQHSLQQNGFMLLGTTNLKMIKLNFSSKACVRWWWWQSNERYLPHFVCDNNDACNAVHLPQPHMINYWKWVNLLCGNCVKQWTRWGWM